MAVGIILGNFTDADIILEKVKSVEVSLPLGVYSLPSPPLTPTSIGACTSKARRHSAPPLLPPPFFLHSSDPPRTYTAIAIISMMLPILCRVSPTALFKLFSGRQIWQHFAFSLFVDWIFAPLLMVGLSWAFLPDKTELREGLILVDLPRCIAMVSFSAISARNCN